MESLAPLSNCLGLTQLFCCDNLITTLTDMSPLPNLQVLWLNSNKLTTLDGIGNFPELTSFWACNNQISSIDPSLFDDLTNLSEMNLSGNLFTFFQDILDFQSISSLTTLFSNYFSFIWFFVWLVSLYQILILGPTLCVKPPILAYFPLLIFPI